MASSQTPRFGGAFFLLLHHKAQRLRLLLALRKGLPMIFGVMPTYVYETIPQREGEAPQRFELRQSMSEPALQQHPSTGQPVRRVPVGGTGIMGSASSSNPASAAASRGGCGTGCGCH